MSRATGWEASGSLPTSSRRLQRLFAFYVRQMMRRSFRAVRVGYPNRPESTDNQPLIIISNHPSWWDPLVCLCAATTFFKNRKHYAPIDAEALEQYQFFRRLGFFGVEQDSHRGAATFLRTSNRILSSPESVLWMTPQGAFADVRRRPVKFKSGVGHLAKGLPAVAVIPFAVEYVFGEERLPEIWARFGPRVESGSAERLNAAQWTAKLAGALETTQDLLAADVIDRRGENYEVLLAGGAGVGGVYDLWRRAKAWMRGEKFHPEHGREAL